LAMVVTFAGTGFLILALCLPIFVMAKRRWSLVLLGILGAVALIAVGDYLHLDRFIARAHEFSSVGSSGFARFVGGFYFFDQFLWADPLRTLFGFGAGTFKLYAIRAHYPVAEMAISKMIFEYGLVGALAYFSFLFYCMSSSALPKVAIIATAMTLLLNGNYVPFAHGLALSLLVWTSSPGWNERAARKPRADRTIEFAPTSDLPGKPSVSAT